MARHRRRKCRHCGELYHADHRNRYHQRYCSKPACKKASKAAANRKWLRGRGRGYHAGAVAVERVRRWRQRHPQYWRRSRPKPRSALQDLLSAQGTCGKGVRLTLNESPLQDLLMRQTVLLTGLIAHLSGDALQDNIESVVNGCMAVGRRLLEQGISLPELVGGLARERQTRAVPRAPATPP